MKLNLGVSTGMLIRSVALVLPPGWCTRVFRELPAEKKADYDTLYKPLEEAIDRSGEKKLLKRKYSK